MALFHPALQWSSPYLKFNSLLATSVSLRLRQVTELNGKLLGIGIANIAGSHEESADCYSLNVRLELNKAQVPFAAATELFEFLAMVSPLASIRVISSLSMAMDGALGES